MTTLAAEELGWLARSLAHFQEHESGHFNEARGI